VLITFRAGKERRKRGGAILKLGQAEIRKGRHRDIPNPIEKKDEPSSDELLEKKKARGALPAHTVESPGVKKGVAIHTFRRKMVASRCHRTTEKKEKERDLVST